MILFEITGRLNDSSPEEREAEIEKARQMLREPTNLIPQELIEAWVVLGESHKYKGEIELAETAYLKVIAIIQTLRNDELLLEGYQMLTSAMWSQEPLKQIKYNGKEAEIWERRNDLDNLTSTLEAMAYASERMEHEVAQCHYLSIITLQPGLGLISKARFLDHIGWLLGKSGEYQPAIEVLEEALNCYEIAGFYKEWDIVLEQQAELYQRIGNETAAQQSLARRKFSNSLKDFNNFPSQPVPPEVEIQNWLTQLTDQDGQVRETAIKKLGQAKNQTVVSELITLLQDKATRVRRAVAWSSGEIGNITALPNLFNLLEDDDNQVIEATIWALGRLGQQLTEQEQQADIVHALVKALDKHDFLVRWAAVVALRHIKPSYSTQLLDLLENEDYLVRRAAVIVLAKTRDAAAVPRLLATLNNNDWQLQVAVIEALGEIESPVALPELLKALEYEKEEVRRSAALALGKIGERAAVPGLLKSLNDPETQVDSAIIRALGEIGDVAAAPVLVDKFVSNSSYGQFEVLHKALVQIGAPVVPYLLEALSNIKIEGELIERWSNQSIYIRICQALGDIGETTAIPALTHILLDHTLSGEDERVPIAAAYALEKIGTSEAIAAVEAWQQPKQAS
jgi:HEAT repeat protein